MMVRRAARDKKDASIHVVVSQNTPALIDQTEYIPAGRWDNPVV